MKLIQQLSYHNRIYCVPPYLGGGVLGVAFLLIARLHLPASDWLTCSSLPLPLPLPVKVSPSASTSPPPPPLPPPPYCSPLATPWNCCATWPPTTWPPSRWRSAGWQTAATSSPWTAAAWSSPTLAARPVDVRLAPPWSAPTRAATACWQPVWARRTAAPTPVACVPLWRKAGEALVVEAGGTWQQRGHQALCWWRWHRSVSKTTAVCLSVFFVVVIFCFTFLNLEIQDCFS